LTGRNLHFNRGKMKLKPADFAREAGVSRQAISMKIKNNTLVVDAAGFMDTDNPINSAYISDPDRSRRKAAAASPSLSAGNAPPSAPAAGIAAATGPPATPSGVRSDADIAAAAGTAVEMLSMTIRDLVMAHAGVPGIERYTKILRDLTATAEREQRTREHGLKLIEKDFVTSRVFAFVDSVCRQIIEYPEAAADAIIAKIMSEGPEARPSVVSMMQEALGRIIAETKNQIVRELDSLKGKYQKEEKQEMAANENS
jgi:transcriptional regulator with XRE-family HTH domain